MDQFTFNVKLPDKPFTRRGILSTVASLFDPLGFVAPVLLEAKQILQTLNKRNLGWDEPIAEVELEQWRFWLEGLPVLNSIEIPRCFKSPEFGRTISMQIHHFADASSYGYGACSYLRLVDHSGSICLSFFMGKSRLAPIKSVSIPRLELTAAVLAARLDELAKRELKIPLDSFLWVDSTAVLYCIRNITKRFPVFVANRLATIESFSNINQWNYVPSKLNPADIASRGLKAQKLKTSEWLQGPTFLLQSQSMWPSFKINIERPPIEFIPANSQSVQSVIATEKAIDTTNQLINHCSSFDKLKETYSLVIKIYFFAST